MRQSLRNSIELDAHRSRLCATTRTLGLGSYFKEPNDALVNQFLGEQIEDGGWNCEAPKGRRSSFHIQSREARGCITSVGAV
jgi:hypothetical protein